MPDASPTTPDELPSALARLTTSLPGLSPSVPQLVLHALWDGLGLARACGLAAARTAPAEWNSRQRNAETVEYLLARELARTAAATSRPLSHRSTTAATEARGTTWAAIVVQAILDFAHTAEPLARTTAETAATWDDQRSFAACVSLFSELAACWRGERPAYQLRYTDTRTSPWWNHPPCF
ncbi:hypothetical protein [Amycolatopsis alba]|uniref:hypothetical protein n=1 Tax=Amycolatopsis alba TaxID=76020 RepID=UPI000BB45301|nr:hypothetical protein [Amycolatopsis alba]